MFETLTDKDDNALRTSTLLHSDAPAFVLFLHGFSLDLLYDAAQSVGYESDLGLYSFRFELARNLAPTPLVLVRNPAQSESLVGIFPGASEAAPTTFALDLDDTWETSVGALIEAASFVVVRTMWSARDCEPSYDCFRSTGASATRSSPTRMRRKNYCPARRYAVSTTVRWR